MFVFHLENIHLEAIDTLTYIRVENQSSLVPFSQTLVGLAEPYSQTAICQPGPESMCGEIWRLVLTTSLKTANWHNETVGQQWMRSTWWQILPLESKGLGLPGMTSSWYIILMFLMYFLVPVSFKFIPSICKGLKVSIPTNHSLLEIDGARC